MATHRPGETTPGIAAADENIGERVVGWVHEFFCGLHGHDNLMQFGRGRMYLKCVSCGHESPGWTIKERQATESPTSVTTRRRRFLPHFAGLKRAA
jgi:hypothetical protein